jgi:chemotaxis protein CheZ
VPAAQTRNSGIELEAVVQETEAATNAILEAAEEIQAWVELCGADKATLAALTGKVSAIFEACAFQDVTGQRVRRAIQHLQQVDDVLQQLIPAGAGQPASPTPPRVEVSALIRTLDAPAASGDLGQAAIDALLRG